MQNGYPNSEILAAIGNKAVVMVVNAGFSLDKQGMKTVTNKSEIDLPYGSLSQASSREKLQEEIGQLFLGNPLGLSARCDDNIIVDIMKKTQYAAKGAKSEVSLRAPRTEIQVREAATKIQKRLTPKLL